MTDSEPGSRLRFGKRNYLLLGSAAGALTIGYYLLAQGSVGLAPVLLVLGYCVLFPFGLALSPKEGE